MILERGKGGGKIYRRDGGEREGGGLRGGREEEGMVERMNEGEGWRNCRNGEKGGGMSERKEDGEASDSLSMPVKWCC